MSKKGKNIFSASKSRKVEKIVSKKNKETNLNNCDNYNNLNEEIECYKRMLERGCAHYGIYYNLGLIYEKQNKYDEAIESYRESIKINNENDNIYKNLGTIYARRREFDEAIRCFKKAFEINNNDYDNCNNLGGVYLDQEDYENAEEYLKKAITIDNKKEKAHSDLGVTYAKQNKYDEAVKSLKKVIEINDKNERAYNDLAIIYAKQSKYDEAVRYLKKVIKINDKNDKTYCDLGNIRSDLKNYSEAIEYFNKSISINNKNDKAYSGLGFIFLMQGVYEEAVKCFKKAFEINKNKKNYESIVFTLVMYLDKLLTLNKEIEKINILEENIYKFLYEDSIIKPMKNNTSFRNIYSKELKIPETFKEFWWNDIQFSTIIYILTLYIKNKYIIEYKNLAKFIDKEDFEKLNKINIFSEVDSRDINRYKMIFLETIKNEKFMKERLVNIFDLYISIMNKLTAQIERKNEKAKAEVRIEEKDRIIQNLYHNLKNKIPKIYFSIENIIEDLEEEGEKVPNTLRKSLLLTKDLEDTANVVLGASKISKDYLLSAINNNNKQISLKKVINNSILNALSYVPLDRSDINIVNKFSINNMEEVFSFIKDKLFNIDFNTDYLEYCYLSQDHIIDNKYSVTSVLSNMFDELLINLFKYTSKDGFIEVNILSGAELVFILKNNSKIGNKESTGKGRYIIETTIQSIGGKYKHYWENDIYITEISLNNYWSKND